VDATFFSEDSVAGRFTLGIQAWGWEWCTVHARLTVTGDGAPAREMPPGLEVVTPGTERCRLDMTWGELSQAARADAEAAWSGGLGTLIYPNLYETWYAPLPAAAPEAAPRPAPAPAPARSLTAAPGPVCRVCVSEHQCAGSDPSRGPGASDPMCFVYHEGEHVFVPWGRATDLSFKLPAIAGRRRAGTAGGQGARGRQDAAKPLQRAQTGAAQPTQSQRGHKAVGFTQKRQRAARK
jgi:hypothetical protein